MLQSVGKRVLQALYFHHSVASALSPEIQDKLRRAEDLTQASPERDYNVVKINEDGATLSLLHYPDFFNTAFPVLMTSWRVDLIQQTVRRRSYQSSLNPPILHRKELLLLSDHPRYAEYAALSKAAEELGLFANPTRIGFKQAWDRLIIEAGYQV